MMHERPASVTNHSPISLQAEDSSNRPPAPAANPGPSQQDIGPGSSTGKRPQSVHTRGQRSRLWPQHRPIMIQDPFPPGPVNAPHVFRDVNAPTTQDAPVDIRIASQPSALPSTAGWRFGAPLNGGGGGGGGGGGDGSFVPAWKGQGEYPHPATPGYKPPDSEGGTAHTPRSLFQSPGVQRRPWVENRGIQLKGLYQRSRSSLGYMTPGGMNQLRQGRSNRTKGTPQGVGRSAERARQDRHRLPSTPIRTRVEQFKQTVGASKNRCMISLWNLGFLID